MSVKMSDRTKSELTLEQAAAACLAKVDATNPWVMVHRSIAGVLELNIPIERRAAVAKLISELGSDVQERQSWEIKTHQSIFAAIARHDLAALGDRLNYFVQQVLALMGKADPAILRRIGE
jgi:hypothetical protein